MGGRLASFVSPLTVSVAIVSDGFSWKKNANCISAPKGRISKSTLCGFRGIPDLSQRPSAGRSLLRADDAPKADVAHSGIDHLRLARRWAVTKTVIGSAKKRPALNDLARNAELGLC